MKNELRPPNHNGERGPDPCPVKSGAERKVTMSVTDNKAIIRRWAEEFWNAGNLAVADELLHPNYVWQDQPAGKQSLAAVKEAYAFWHRVVPDLYFTIDEIIAEGDAVVALWTSRATHQGEWDTGIGTLPATGKPTVTSGMTSYHFKDGKIIHDIGYTDYFGTLQQLGAVVQVGETNR
jgi:steroid delta-isomerase-like uncharacterized protein